MIVLAIVAGLAAILYWQFGQYLDIHFLAEQEAKLRGFQDAFPLLVIGIAFLIYVSVTGFSLPGAAILTLIVGWYFGFLRGLVLVSFASTTGATIAFLMSRYFFQDAIQSKFSERLRLVNEALEREGAFYLFTLRLTLAVPFFVINAVMGLTKIRTWTFWWVSQIGMLPGTMVYVYAGSIVPDLQTLAEKGVRAAFTRSQMIQFIIAFALLGIFPLATKWTLRYFRKKQTTA
ncbi:MAG: TVP38/TMEM64 family protein [Planctomycetota bacterium]|nr:MAG: TVP38/TMEM64 family protein [Planctomycetota bacterium]REJ96910.1 MAG: TVP38/TMEM64 family protein [Planctomycetota bacterium]REK24594.1 MAG: TVP38/TMEM64 family protein [Planctomycetota bacterium]REK45980.1 MAG: TVP38/TMEM64 family protein [Planctomycetota bacterium]